MYVDSKLGSCAGEYGLAVGRVHGIAYATASPSLGRGRRQGSMKPERGEGGAGSRSFLNWVGNWAEKGAGRGPSPLKLRRGSLCRSGGNGKPYFCSV